MKMGRIILSGILALSMIAVWVVCSSADSVAASLPTSDEGTGKTAGAGSKSDSVETPEIKTIHWARANSGNIFVTLAQQKGYFEEVGLTVIEEPILNSTEALTALGVGRVDVTSNQGTNMPLSQIAAGQDFTIVGGYMLQGMYVVAKKGTGWNGPKDLIGKKVAANASETTLTGALIDLGYDPIKEIEWLNYSTNSDRLAAVVAGEADYALLSGDLLYTVGNMDDIEIVVYLSDPGLTPAYGCCRMNMRTNFVKENPITVKLILKALIRAQAYFEAHKDESVSILAKEIDVSEEYVAAYLLNENYKPSVDPVKNRVIKTWNILKATGFLPAKADSVNIVEHINIEFYKTALDEVISEHYDEYPDFFDGRFAFFKEYNY
jgi:NitT/TauT family transport system substrate-binding protein